MGSTFRIKEKAILNNNNNNKGITTFNSLKTDHLCMFI